MEARSCAMGIGLVALSMAVQLLIWLWKSGTGSLWPVMPLTPAS
jgi:hypothetical protein